MFAKKNLDLFVIALLVLSVVMYDVTIEILAEVFHLIFEILHNLFEWVELGIEHAVEHMIHALHIGDTIEYLFETDRHGSQVVTFYILVTIIGFGFYRLWKALPRFYRFIEQIVLEVWIRRSTQVKLYWQSLTPLHKAAVVTAGLGVAYLASFFIM